MLQTISVHTWQIPCLSKRHNNSSNTVLYSSQCLKNRDCIKGYFCCPFQKLWVTKLYCTALHCTTLHYTTLHCTALHYTALHYTTLHCTTLHCTALHCTALHCTKLHCTALHCTTLHCTALHHQKLHYITSQVHEEPPIWVYNLDGRLCGTTRCSLL